eukprot:1157778-Pelagomonas_calceolata.AAC.17
MHFTVQADWFAKHRSKRAAAALVLINRSRKEAALNVWMRVSCVLPFSCKYKGANILSNYCVAEAGVPITRSKLSTA